MTTAVLTPKTRVQLAEIAKAGLTYDQHRIARAIAIRWDGAEFQTTVVAAVAEALDAEGPQWAFKITKGYFLDVVRDELAAAKDALIGHPSIV